MAFAMVAVAQSPTPKQHDLPPFLDEFKGGTRRELPPFLDDFFADNGIRVVISTTRIPSAVGDFLVGMATPVDTKGHSFKSHPLPAILLVYDEAAWPPAAIEGHARDLASIGYQVLMINLEQRRVAAKKDGLLTDEGALAQLLAGVRHLRREGDGPQQRIGVIGWGWAGGQALALAMAVQVQACVFCEASVPHYWNDTRVLTGTPLLGVYGGDGGKAVAFFRRSLEQQRIECKWHFAAQQTPGFMGPPDRKAYNHDAAEDAWVAIYNFLEKHLEDARPSEIPATPSKAIATIADMMRAVNEPTGVRGALSRALEQAPKTAREWGQVRAHAALVAESGVWLQARTPAKGPTGHWQEQAQAFTAAAGTIVDAADRRDYPAARQGLQKLAGQCAACHNEHR